MNPDKKINPDPKAIEKECPDCEGLGYTQPPHSDTCTTCNGTGKVPNEYKDGECPIN